MLKTNLMLEVMVMNHAGQTDKSGKAYAFHPIEVMRILNSDDDDLNAIALGHDLLEDTKVTFMELYTAFGARVANGIKALTKKNGQSYSEYLNQVKSNPDAVLVKMADLRHNSDFTRLRGVTEDRIIKYMNAYKELEECLK